MRFYPGLKVEDIGRMTIGQIMQRAEDMAEILKMESGGEGGSGKALEDMTADEKIEYYRSIGKIGKIA